MEESILISLSRKELSEIMLVAVKIGLSQHQPNPSPAEGSETLWTSKEVCRHIGITLPTLHSWKVKGRIPFIRIGRRAIRFKKLDVLAALEKSKKGGFAV